MSRYDPSARIPLSNMSAYIGSTPKAPLAQAAAHNAAHPPPAEIQSAEMSVEQLKVEGRAVMKHCATHIPRMLELVDIFEHRWKEFGATRDLACNEFFGCSLQALRHKTKYWQDKLGLVGGRYLNPEEDKENTLTHIAALPLTLEMPELTTPIAQDPEPTKPAKAKAKPEEPLENGETVADYKLKPKANQPPSEHKPREDRENGKPKHALAIWSEMEGLHGRCLNRADELNRLCPNKRLHDLLIDQEHACSETLGKWRESVKNNHHA